MSYIASQRKTDLQLQRLIQRAAGNSSYVVFTQHAAQQMIKRRILRPEVDRCLKLGCIRRPPEPNVFKGSLECRMESYVAGRNIGVIVAITDEEPLIVIVTAMVLP